MLKSHNQIRDFIKLTKNYDIHWQGTFQDKLDRILPHLVSLDPLGKQQLIYSCYVCEPITIAGTLYKKSFKIDIRIPEVCNWIVESATFNTGLEAMIFIEEIKRQLTILRLSKSKL